MASVPGIASSVSALSGNLHLIRNFRHPNTGWTQSLGEMGSLFPWAEPILERYLEFSMILYCTLFKFCQDELLASCQGRLSVGFGGL